MRSDIFCTGEQGMPWFRMWNELTNESRETILLEMISSFSLTGISPYLEGDCHDQIQVHRLMSRVEPGGNPPHPIHGGTAAGYVMEHGVGPV